MNRKPPPRLRSFGYVGFHRYLLTICTYERQPVFRRPAVVGVAIAHLRTTATRFSFVVIAYCFMPDHVHVLLQGERDDADFRNFVRVWKQMTSFYSKHDLGVRLWQRSFHERVLRDDESTERAARYLLCNPVRAGLVASPEHYPWIGSFVTTVEDLLYRAQDVGPT